MSEEGKPGRRPTGLGRGLSALLGDIEREAPVSGGERGEGIALLAVAEIEPNPQQPRASFDDAALAELARSIKARGLIQPIVVRRAGAKYQIVAGERRWRAAQKARLHEIPALVRELDDEQTLEIALVENIQRRDLNAIEEARGYRRLMKDYGHSQEELARLVHKSRSHIANLLRLLELPESVQDMVMAGRLDMGHARALITADDPEALALEVARRGLSVRETERLARERREGGDAREGRIEQESADADVAALERRLSAQLGLKVRIAARGSGGKVTLSYSSLDQLDLICQRLSGERI
ncbi:MAG: ParB/RepB/Spo0J family partition protein [Sphingomonadaceae bacterium]